MQKRGPVWYILASAGPFLINIRRYRGSPVTTLCYILIHSCTDHSWLWISQQSRSMSTKNMAFKLLRLPSLPKFANIPFWSSESFFRNFVIFLLSEYHQSAMFWEINVNKQHWEHTKKLVGRAHLVEVLGQLGGKLKLSKEFSSSLFANTILRDRIFI